MREVSFDVFVSCVQAQVDFLVEFDGRVQVRGTDHADVREAYAHGVSVDGCANMLTM